jgi:hypothetical protein
MSRSRLAAIVDLKALEAGTDLTLTNRCTSRQQRDAMVSYRAEKGAKAASERLPALLRRA